MMVFGYISIGLLILGILVNLLYTIPYCVKSNRMLKEQKKFFNSDEYARFLHYLNYKHIEDSKN